MMVLAGWWEDLGELRVGHQTGYWLDRLTISKLQAT